MNDSNQDAPSHQDQQEFERHRSRANWAWWFFAAIALFYLISEHRAHLLGVLPFLLLLSCPFMHLFMHHGHHGRHGSHGAGANARKEDDKPEGDAQ